MNYIEQIIEILFTLIVIIATSWFMICISHDIYNPQPIKYNQLTEQEKMQAEKIKKEMDDAPNGFIIMITTPMP